MAVRLPRHHGRPDRNVGKVFDCLDELGITEDTIVVYSTDNGPHRNSWPDAGTTPFRSEKDTNWEGRPRTGVNPVAWQDQSRGYVQRDFPAPRSLPHCSLPLATSMSATSSEMATP